MIHEPAVVPTVVVEGAPPPARRSPAWWVAAAMAAALAAWTLTRLPAATRPSGGGDFATVYTAARLWAGGGDPYDQRQIDRAWVDAGGGPAAPPPHAPPTWVTAAPTAARTPSVYPPGTLAGVAPVAAALRWPAARAAWAGLSVVLLAAMLAVLPGLAGLRWADARAPAVVAAALLFTSFRSGLALGQPAVAATGLVVLGMAVAAADRDAPAAVALLAAAALKPQVALPFVGYLLLCKRWRLGLGVLAGVAVVNGLAAARLWAAGVPWVAGMRANLWAAAAAGGINDASRSGPGRYSMVNVQVLLHLMTDSRRVVTGLTAALLGTAAAGFAAAVVRARPAGRSGVVPAGLPARGAAELAFVAAWTLLPVYHRWYDLDLVVLVLPWVAVALPDRRWTAAALAVAVAAVPCMVNVALLRPGPWRGVPLAVWADLVLPNQCWAACLLCVLLLVVLCRRQRGTVVARVS